MSNVSSMSPIVDGTATSNLCLASVVSANFSKFIPAINSNALNSQNYGISQVRSEHILTSEFKSTHLSNSQVYSVHFSNVTFRESHVNYASSATGARFLRIGPTNASVPASGIVIQHYSTATTMTTGTNVTISWPITLTKPGGTEYAFGGVPWPVGTPYGQVSETTTRFGAGFRGHDIINLGSQFCTVVFTHALSQVSAVNLTLHAQFMGPGNG